MSVSVSVGVDVVVWVFRVQWGGWRVCVEGVGGPGQRVCGSDDLLVRGETFGV